MQHIEGILRIFQKRQRLETTLYRQDVNIMSPSFYVISYRYVTHLTLINLCVQTYEFLVVVSNYIMLFSFLQLELLHQWNLLAGKSSLTVEEFEYPEVDINLSEDLLRYIDGTIDPKLVMPWEDVAMVG